jgi:hypothetical protein
MFFLLFVMIAMFGSYIKEKKKKKEKKKEKKREIGEGCEL